jgi:hypothetical protein
MQMAIKDSFISVYYNGKTIFEIDHPLIIEIINDIKILYENLLDELKFEINKHDGLITLNIEASFKRIKISYYNMPVELITKIEEILN